MKSNIKFLTIGLIIGVLLTMTTPVLAESIVKQIDVIFNNVNVNVNGEELEADNILYNGTTYIPIRDVAEILDKDVIWNQETMTVTVNDKSNDDLNKIKYQKFMNMFDVQVERSASLNGKTYLYYEFLYNGDLNDEEFDKWLSGYEEDLNSFVKEAFNENGTYGVLNSITDFNRKDDNGRKYNIGRAINDINGLLIEIN